MAEVYNGTDVPALGTGFQIGVEDAAGNTSFADSNDVGGLPRPRIYFVGSERRETRQTVEPRAETSEPIPVRAVTPILVIGETAIADYTTEGATTYRFVV